MVLDAKAYRDEQRNGRAPLTEKAVLIMSFNYANALREELKAIAWDLVVVDEAHKLRNAYRPSNKVGQGIRWATEDCRKLLLTATPLQNSLLELFGLSTLIDEHLFGDLNAFRAQYASAGSSIDRLCVSASRGSASARCATRSPSSSATPNGGRSRDRSSRATTSTHSMRRCPRFCSDLTAMRSRNANAT